MLHYNMGLICLVGNHYPVSNKKNNDENLPVKLMAKRMFSPFISTSKVTERKKDNIQHTQYMEVEIILHNS